MAKADLDHPALEKVPFYEALLIHRKDIHTASDHSAGLFLRYYKQQHIAYVDGEPMLDGGIVDSIPVLRAIEQGFDIYIQEVPWLSPWRGGY